MYLDIIRLRLLDSLNETREIGYRNRRVIVQRVQCGKDESKCESFSDRSPKTSVTNDPDRVSG
jgi:hypothetical protein